MRLKDRFVITKLWKLLTLPGASTALALVLYIATTNAMSAFLHCSKTALQRNNGNQNAVSADVCELTFTVQVRT